ncbi:MAG TPA: prepilin-type N-terminal cleavage/methylation domain-containing protein [Gaiellaceae bacterium]|nr:prepilin-type N-terminal cleavage/methylation domain-containing protein [Gaiellaceae bacterium]
MRREDGFTLLELLAVIVIMAILLAVAVGFQIGARERANDATAKANIRSAVPAIEAYRADTGTYVGMTQAALKSQYSPGIASIVVVSASANAYCVRATEGGTTWYKLGPDGQITKTACS